MTEQGAQVGTTVLTQRIVPAPVAVAAELALEETADVVELERLRSVDGAPNHVAHSFLPASMYPRAAEEDFSQGSLYEFLRREYQADLAHARIVVDVGTAAPEEADRLRVVAGSPLLVVRTTVRDSSDHPLVHSYSRLRPDVSQVEFEVSVGGR
jgi:GntR family transcriptional regulator